MKIKLNGEEKEIDDGANLQALINKLNLCCSKTVLSVNDEVIIKDKYGKIILKPGDSVEIFSFVGGG